MTFTAIRRPIFIAALLCCPLVALAQGLTWETTTTIAAKDAGTMNTTSHYLPRMFKHGSEQEATIFRLDKQMIYTVDYETKEAVVWGTIIMGVTGLIVWFKMDVTHWLPRWAVDVALTIHYYEAILACLAIVAWHFYHVIFDPDVYPLNLACWGGRVSEHWHEEEHGLDSLTRVCMPHNGEPASPVQSSTPVTTIDSSPKPKTEAESVGRIKVRLRWR